MAPSNPLAAAALTTTTSLLVLFVSNVAGDILGPDCTSWASSLAGGSPEEVAATPRENANLELLALHLAHSSQAPRLTAEQAVYDRLVADVAAIKAEHTELQDVNFLSTRLGDGKKMMLSTRSGSWEEDSGYWHCANIYYGLDSEEPNPGGMDFYMLDFKGIYDIFMLAQDYERMNPNLNWAGPDSLMGDGNTILVDVADKANLATGEWKYSFVEGSGDCPSGCIDKKYTCFKSLPGVAPIKTTCPEGREDEVEGNSAATPLMSASLVGTLTLLTASLAFFV